MVSIRHRTKIEIGVVLFAGVVFLVFGYIINAITLAALAYVILKSELDRQGAVLAAKRMFNESSSNINDVSEAFREIVGGMQKNMMFINAQWSEMTGMMGNECVYSKPMNRDAFQSVDDDEEDSDND